MQDIQIDKRLFVPGGYGWNNINKVQRKGLCKNAAQNGKKEAKYKVLQDGLSSQVSGVFQRI